MSHKTALGVAIAVFAAQSVAAAQTPQSVTLSRPLATFSVPFSRVAAIREEPDGRVLVLDDIEFRILRVAFGSDSVVPIGRSGRGPGEFTLPLNLIALAGDTTFAIDGVGGGQALLITSLGARPHRLPAAGVPDGTPLFYRPDIQADAKGNLYELVRLIESGLQAAGLYGVRRLDRASGQQDTIGQVSQQMRSPLARPPSGAAGGASGAQASRSAGPPPPFASGDQWAVAPDGRIAIVTVEPYRVQYIEPLGGRVEGPVLDVARIPVTSALKAQWRERQEQPLAGLQMGAGGVMTPTRMRRPYQEPQAWPDVLPAFLLRALRFAPDGRLWVERAAAAGSGQTFDVIDGRGRVARRVTLPQGERLVGFGRRGIYTVRRDEDDLEYLQLHAALP